MPVPENLIKIALAFAIGLAVTHPMTFALELRKIELKILREASDTRSWGSPDIFHYVPPRDIGSPFEPEHAGMARVGRTHHAQ